MVANTALGFFLGGLGLFFSTHPSIFKTPQTQALAVMLCAGSLVLLGLTALAEHLFDFSLGIDELFVRGEPDDLASSPGQMALMTAFNFTLLGLIFLLRQKQAHFEPQVNEALSAIILGTAGLALMGYLFHPEALHQLSVYASMALLTALLFALLALGVLLALTQSIRLILSYGMTLAAVALAFKFYLAIGIWYGPGLPTFVLFYPVIMLASLLAGLGPGLFALILCVLVTATWIYEPLGFLKVGVPINQVALIIFIFNGLFINGVTQLYRRNRQKLINFERQQSERLFTELVERSPFGVYVVDARFKIVMMNTGSQTGAFRNVHPVIGRDFGEAMRILWLEDVAAEIIGHFRHTLETGEPYHSPRFVNPRHDVGIVESYEWELHRMTLPDGQNGVICYYYDSTKLRQAETALRESDRNYQALFNNPLIGMCHCQVVLNESGQPVDYRFRHVNDAFADMTGLAKEAVLDHTARELMSGIEHAAFDYIGVHGKVALTGEPTRFEVYQEHLQRWYSVFVYSPQREYFISIFSDITERKQTEEALQGQKRLLQSITDNADTALFIMDDRQQCVFMNPAAEKLSGYRLAETKGRALHDVVHHTRPDGSPYPLSECPIDQAFPKNDREQGEEIFIHKDGHFYPVAFTASPLRNEQGQPNGTIIEVRDITERKLAENELERVRGLLAEGQRIAHLGSFEIVPPKGEILWSDEQFRIFGLEPGPVAPSYADLLARHFYPDDTETVEQIFSKALRTRGVVECTHRIIRPDGSVRWIHSVARPDFDANGTLVKYIGATLDITEQRTLEQSLREADQRKDEFLATLAHELRNPLAPIRTGIQVLQMGGITHEKSQGMLAIMDRQMSHLVRLVDDLLEISRITCGKIELKKERIDLRTVLQQAVDISRPLLDRGGHTLEVNVPPEPVWCDADPVRIIQILANLLNNAAKYTEPGGRIEVVAERQEHEAILRMRDNGIGIPAPMLGRVFDLFSQVDRHLNRSQGGLGIGLALVRQLVEMHGGQVTAHSEGEHRGSEFTVVLPLSEQAPDTVSTAEEIISPSSNRRVLVVDDNRDAADTNAMMLKMLGAEVLIACSGPEALEAVANFRPDLILLDLGMPGMDGYETAKQLRLRPEGQTVQLVALSGWGQDEDRQRTREAGFDDHLVKPVDYPTLQSLLNSRKNFTDRTGSTE